MRTVFAFVPFFGIALSTPLETRSLDQTTPCGVTSGITEAYNKINAAYKDPMSACYWWKLNNAGVTTDSTITGWDMNYGCDCLISEPARAKSTLKSTAKGKTPADTVRAAVAKPQQFCTYWLADYTQVSTPFLTLSLQQIQRACKTILGKDKLTKNYITNPNFQGSGSTDASSTTFNSQDNLNLPGWDHTGRVSVVPPYKNNPSGGNMALLQGGVNSSSSIRFQAETWGPPGMNNTLSWRDIQTCSGKTCLYIITMNDVVIWNNTLHGAGFVDNYNLKSRGPITFLYPTGGSGDLRFSAACGDKACSNEWYLADMSLTAAK